MFRASQISQFDEPVAKATDENLTSENWEYILDVCDRVGSSESNGRDVVAAVERRLLYPNANTQLYSLELANSLVQNCGINVHREISSRHFTDTLLRIANAPSTPHQVKANVYERLEEWARLFAANPELGIIEEAYVKLKSQNPSLRAPSKPTKTEITDYDRQREQEDLRMALELSVKDGNPYAAAASSSSSAQNNPSYPGPSQPTGFQQQQQQQQQQPTQQHAPVSSGTSAATVSRVRALYDFTPSEPGELAFRKGDIIAVLESVYKDWWKGSLRGQTGIFPLNYVEKLTDPTPEEMAREAQTEAEVFGQIKNVEKLLTLLSSGGEGNVAENEEITKLYHETLAIRPKLIELIGKYSQKKDDFTQLNEKFIKARRDYEALLEASMSAPTAAVPAAPAAPSTNPYARPPQTSPYGYPPQPPQQSAPYPPQPAQTNPYLASPPAAPQAQYPPDAAAQSQSPYGAPGYQAFRPGPGAGAEDPAAFYK